MATLYNVNHWVGEVYVQIYFKPSASLFGTDMFQVGQDLSHFAHEKRREFVRKLSEAYAISTEVDFLQGKLDSDEYYQYIKSLGLCLSGCLNFTDKSFGHKRLVFYVFLAKI